LIAEALNHTMSCIPPLAARSLRPVAEFVLESPRTERPNGRISAALGPMTEGCCFIFRMIGDALVDEGSEDPVGSYQSNDYLLFSSALAGGCLLVWHMMRSWIIMRYDTNGRNPSQAVTHLMQLGFNANEICI